MNKLISELVIYGVQRGLVDTEDKMYTINRLLEIFKLNDFTWMDVKVRPIQDILSDLTDYAVKDGILKEDTIANRDLFDTKIMGVITPMPAVVRNRFNGLYAKSPKFATDYYYQFSQDTNYIRVDRIVKDEKWKVDTKYGQMDITINLSKPEKDPRDLLKPISKEKKEYPKCLLCKENEGYSGTLSHPARQNHRIIPVILDGQNYYMQYSPYVYYNEHCIVFHEQHIPMVIDKHIFPKLLDFTSSFPHYTIGSNADLPIVGGSILSHDHFQGGAYHFAMEKAPYEFKFDVEGYTDVVAGVLRWPMSVIRLQSENKERIEKLSGHILESWKTYTDEEAFIYSETDGIPHNTITPIARRVGSLYEMNLVLRNNITTKERPWGLFHSEERYHHIKKENIGLIEVMGLAVLPARLKKEMELLAEAILENEDIRSIDSICKHADWVDEWKENYELTSENIKEVLHKEIGNRFVQVLECTAVFKRTADGMAQFKRFLKSL